MNSLAKVEYEKKYGQEFRSIFHFPLHSVVDMFGFDVISFDLKISVPHNTSIKDFVLKKHGQKAVDLLQKMLDEDFSRNKIAHITL